MATPALESLLLGSPDQAKLRDWYCAAFGVTPDENGFVSFGGVGMLIDARDDVTAPNPEPGRYILNFHVDDADAVAAHLESLGVTWLAKPEDRGPGIFGTLLDPDGNYVQIIQFSTEYLEEMAAKRFLASTTPFSGFTSDDIPAAKTFYQETMGLTVTESNGMLQLHVGTHTAVLVYPKSDHVPATFTVLNFPVEDIDAEVERLSSLGVKFERYDDSPQDEKGVLRGRSLDMGPDIAWFRDPAGNILSVMQG